MIEIVNLILLLVGVRVHARGVLLDNRENGILKTALRSFCWTLPLTVFVAWPLASTYLRDGVPGWHLILHEAFRLARYFLFAVLLVTAHKGWSARRKKAVNKYRQRAIEQGDAEAQFHLGNAYAKGEGVPQNYREAYIWHSLAVANGIEVAAEYRDGDARKLSPAELSSAKEEAARRHAEIQGGTGN